MIYDLPIESLVVNMFNLNPDINAVKLVDVQKLAQAIIRFCEYDITCNYAMEEIRWAVDRNSDFLYIEDDLIKRIEQSTDDKDDKFFSLKADMQRRLMPPFVRNAVLLCC